MQIWEYISFGWHTLQYFVGHLTYAYAIRNIKPQGNDSLLHNHIQFSVICKLIVWPCFFWLGELWLCLRINYPSGTCSHRRKNCLSVARVICCVLKSLEKSLSCLSVLGSPRINISWGFIWNQGTVCQGHLTDLLLVAPEEGFCSFGISTRSLVD